MPSIIKHSKDKNAKGRYANRDSKAEGSVPAGIPGPEPMTLDIVYDSLREAVFTKDLDGRITSVNELYASYIMLKKEDIIGKTADELGYITTDFAEAIHKADEQVLHSKEPIINRGWSTYPNGARIYTETSKTPLIKDGKPIGVLVTIKDLTELRLMMDEVEKQNKILDVIGKASTLMLEPDVNAFKQSIYDAMKIIADAIGADKIDIWRRYKKDEKDCFSLEYCWESEIITDFHDSRKDQDRRIISGAELPFIERLISKGRIVNSIVRDLPPVIQKTMKKYGAGTALSALLMPIIINEGYWGFISAFDVEEERIFTDNEVLLLWSARQMIASSMARMDTTKELMLQTDRLRYELDSKRDFLARMSHEIRTPLNAILGMTELALRERMSNTANEHIMTVKQTGMNLLAIINDILDFSKIESGNMEIINTGYALSSLIYDIISIIRIRLAYTRIRFITDIDSTLPCGLVGDEGKIRQILINLLSNAVKYTQKGFIKLTIKGKKTDDGMINLIMSVADSGKGIKEEDQQKLFRDYIQVDQEKNIGIEGVGLGLSITHGLVTAMKGTITLESQYGEGSEFTVTIPQKIEDSSKLAQVKEPEKKRTLIYERRSLYVDTLTKNIENLGVQCDVVNSSDEVLLRMQRGTYDYLMGSIELLSELRLKLDALNTDFQIIGIAEFGDETDSIWRTISTPIHTISLANIYNGEAETYIYNDGDDTANRFSAPDARVLVVDDIVTNLKVAAGLLSVYDVEIDICGSGAEAIELARENRYDIIFMDHRMPGMDGVETAEHIRAMAKEPRAGAAAGPASSNGGALDEEYYRTVPIVVLTANVMSNMKEMFLEAGFNDFIAKPIDTLVMGNVMRKWIPKSKQRRYYASDSDTDMTGLINAGNVLSIPGVDVEKGFRTSGGKMDVYLEILATFLDEAGERLSQLHEYTESGDLRMYTVTVHALKGALANIGADGLSAMAMKLEAAGERKDKDYIDKNSERFTSGAARLLVSIRSVLAETAKSAGSGKPAGKEEAEQFIATLRELKTALEDMDAGTMNRAVESLLGDAPTEQSLSAVRQISKHILMAEYDDAESIIDNLISAITNTSLS